MDDLHDTPKNINIHGGVIPTSEKFFHSGKFDASRNAGLKDFTRNENGIEDRLHVTQVFDATDD